jgi:hypothetical protein
MLKCDVIVKCKIPPFIKHRPIYHPSSNIHQTLLLGFAFGANIDTGPLRCAAGSTYTGIFGFPSSFRVMAGTGLSDLSVRLSSAGEVSWGGVEFGMALFLKGDGVRRGGVCFISRGRGRCGFGGGER